jgi:hypothetical protein
MIESLRKAYLAVSSGTGELEPKTIYVSLKRFDEFWALNEAKMAEQGWMDSTGGSKVLAPSKKRPGAAEFMASELRWSNEVDDETIILIRSDKSLFIRKIA